jgi:acyl carrier protein
MSNLLEAITRMAADMSGQDPAEITTSTRLAEDLRIKSVNRIEIAARLEDELGIVLTVSDVLRVKTIGELVELTEARSAA